MLEGFADGALRDFVEGNATDYLAVLVILTFLFLGFRAVAAEFFGQMRGNGFAFAIRVRSQIDGVHANRQLFQLGDDLLFAGNDDVLGLEVIVGIHAKRALRQIFDVPERSLNREALAEIFLNRLGLGRRFDDDESFWQFVPRLF